MLYIIFAFLIPITCLSLLLVLALVPAVLVNLFLTIRRDEPKFNKKRLKYLTFFFSIIIGIILLAMFSLSETFPLLGDMLKVLLPMSIVLFVINTFLMCILTPAFVFASLTNLVLIVVGQEKGINLKILKRLTFIFSIVTGVLVTIMFFSGMVSPIEEFNCRFLEFSPDKAYKAESCEVKYEFSFVSQAHRNTVSIKIYDAKTGKLLSKYVDEILGIYWTQCEDNKDKTCGIHYENTTDGDYIYIDVIDTWWQRFRAKIPLW